MMEHNQEPKKIFISYSWEDQAHTDWVKKLVDELESYKELHMVFDQYDLDSFSDKNHFMEKGVNRSDFLLLIITENYTLKANNRSGGVGIECHMIAARHWEELSASGSSNIIPILHSGSHVPDFLKGKFYIDFRGVDSFNNSLSKVIDHLKGETVNKRPAKTKSLTQDTRKSEVTRVEDFLKINHKNRKRLFPLKETIDFSGSNKIKFEVWETKAPAKGYYLFLFENTIIKQCIERLSTLLKGINISKFDVTVLREKVGKEGYLKNLFRENGIKATVTELDYPEYVWEYCIEGRENVSNSTFGIKYYIDQPLVHEKENTEIGPAFDHLKSIFKSDNLPVANVIVAPGGTGKTTLCQKIAKFFENSDNCLSIVIKAEDIKSNAYNQNFENVQIDSVYDLYEVYANACVNAVEFDRITFEMAVLTGRIALIIDGMDEFISLFPEGLNISQFFKSIEDLNNELNLSKIVITTREDIFAEDLMSSVDGIEKFRLIGFDQSICERYLDNRFKSYDKKANIVSRILNIVSNIINSDAHQRVLPFIVDLLSKIAEESLEDQSGEILELEKEADNIPYESNRKFNDLLVYSVFRREKIRQNIDISISEILVIFLELSDWHRDKFSKENVSEIISLLHQGNTSSLTDKILRNPLLLLEGGTYKYRYDFIESYFVALNIIGKINKKSNSDSFLKMLAKICHGEGQTFKEVARYFENRKDTFYECSQSIVQEIKKNIGYDDVFARHDIEYKAIAFFISVIATFSDSKNSAEGFKNNLLKLEGSDRTISKLGFYGSLPLCDFSELAVDRCRFIKVARFTSSKFNNTKFTSCFFSECKSEHLSDTFNPDMFENCETGDLIESISEFQVKSNNLYDLKETAARDFLNSFFKAGRFIDKKKIHINISNNMKNKKNIIDVYLRSEILSIAGEKKGDKFYVLSKDMEDSAYNFITNNVIDKKIRKLIEKIMI